jgi:hypothetical protein
MLDIELERHMRYIKTILLLSAGATLVLSACGPSVSPGDVTNGSGGSSSLPHCGVFTQNSVCDGCLHQQCCAEIAACGAEDPCMWCAAINPDSASDCSGVTNLALAVIKCGYARCESACRPPISASSSSSSGSEG